MPSTLELRCKGSLARISPEHGARVTRASLHAPDGERVEVLHPYPENATSLLPWAKGGLYPLVPYSGRIANARLLHEGVTHHLAPHPDGLGHTMHGTAHQQPWRVQVHEADHAELVYSHEPDQNWPWRFQARLAVALSTSALETRLSLKNLDRRTMPAGIGLHPFLPCPAGTDLAFRAGPAWQHIDAIPSVRDAGGAREHRLSTASLEPNDLTLMLDGWDGTLSVIGGRHTLRLEADNALRHLVIHRPAHGGYVCVEPVSHVADGFNLRARCVRGTGARVLASGEEVCGQLTIRVER